MSKRQQTLENLFGAPSVKRARLGADTTLDSATTGDHVEYSNHPTYPLAVPHLPLQISDTLNFSPADEGRVINDQPDLDLVYYQPYIPTAIERSLFEFLRRELFFYRVKYTIKRGAVETLINTPRFTTVFGVDESARFNDDGELVDAFTGALLPKDTYGCNPRPLPQCLDSLRVLTENTTGCKFNFALVNYYASGNDSISYHSDDERFLGNEPAIASFTLGAKRDFLLRHKRTPAGNPPTEAKPIKLPLASGDMILMRGRTQSKWEHSIPKRKGGEADNGRINITFRRAMVKGGTANYYRYNVGDGPVYVWAESKREMAIREKNT
jgi:hypothetical protein